MGYVMGYVDGKHVLLSRFLTNAPDDAKVDHVNGNRADHSRENLFVSDSQKNVKIN
jgi:hypothetical protein